MRTKLGKMCEETDSKCEWSRVKSNKMLDKIQTGAKSNRICVKIKRDAGNNKKWVQAGAEWRDIAECYEIRSNRARHRHIARSVVKAIPLVYSRRWFGQAPHLVRRKCGDCTNADACGRWEEETNNGVCDNRRKPENNGLLWWVEIFE